MTDHDSDRLLDLAHCLLDGEAIDWGVEESEVLEGMKRLQQVVGRRDDTAWTRP